MSIMTPEFRVSFPKLFTPDEKGSYRMLMLIPKTTDITELKTAVMNAVNEKWPDPTKRPPSLVNPIKDGDTNLKQDGSLQCDQYPEMKGHWLINVATKRKPGVVDQNVQPIMDQGDFYAGCYARAKVHVYAYAPSKKNPQSRFGVGVGLNNVQKLRDGDSFSGGTKAEDDFDAVMSGAPETGAAPSGVAAGTMDSMFG